MYHILINQVKKEKVMKTFIEALILATLMFVIPLTVYVIRTGGL
jgi:hypothetical protein